MAEEAGRASNPYHPPDPVGDDTIVGGHEFGKRLANTRIGLRLVFFGFTLISVTPLLAIPAFVFDAVLLAKLILWILLGTGLLLLTIGQLLCLSVPQQTGARAWIVGAVIWYVLAIINNFANILFGMIILSWPVSMLMMLGSSALFLCFLMQLARSIGREDLAKRGRTVLIVASGLFFAVILTVFVLDATVNRTMLIIMPVAGGTAMAAVLWMYSLLVWRLGSAIQNSLTSSH